MKEIFQLNLTKSSSSTFMLSAAFITFFMFLWAFISGQQLLRQQAPLIDTVMQLRVDLSQAHQLIDESIVSDKKTLDKAYMNASIAKINKEVNDLYEGNVRLGNVYASISDISELQKPLHSLKNSVDALSTYLDKNYTDLGTDKNRKFIHDDLFADSRIQAKLLDDITHSVFNNSLEYQKTIFIILSITGAFFIAALLFFLRRNEQAKTSALKKHFILSQALEYSGEAAIIASTSGIIAFVNDAFTQMTGYSVEETIGNNPSMLSSGNQNKEFYKNLWTTIKSGGIWRGELVNKKKDGSLYPALMTIAAIHDENGIITHYVANQRDLSEHKALEEYIFQAQKLEALGTLTSGIAHDFNNALAGIVGNLYLLKKSAGDKEKTIKRASTMKDICDTAASHIKQILCYARNDAVLMSPMELNQCVQRSCELVNAMIPATISLEFTPYKQDIYVSWDETQVQQILINLINNARYALNNNENPKITLKTELLPSNSSKKCCNFDQSNGMYIRLSISDNGHGMTKNIMDKIFDPFFTTKKADDGTGLGLSMAYGAIKKIGGHFFVDSEVGIGTTFYICLPIDYKIQDQLLVESQTIYKGNGEIILLADDDKHLLNAQQEVIESFGYNVLTANDGAEAVTMYKEHRDNISVVILDLIMPSLTGTKAAKQILTINPAAKIIFTTGYDDEGYPSDNTIAAPTIYKPYTPESISKIIYEEINGNHKQQAKK